MPLCTTKTPSVSFGFWAESVVAATPAVGAVVVAVPSTGFASFGTSLCCRTVRAMIGIASAPRRVSVTILAVAERSGRMSRGGWSSVTSTSKSTAWVACADASWPATSCAELEIIVTRPVKLVSGYASMVICTESPKASLITSVSSTRTLASTVERSAMVISSAFSRLNVPGTATSPTSTGSRTTRPLIGAKSRVRFRLSRACCTPARAWAVWAIAEL